MRVNFDELALDERRIIVVASDAKYQEIINQPDWTRVLMLAGGPLALMLAGGPLALAVSVFGNAATTSAYVATTFAAMNQVARRKAQVRPLLRRIFTKGEIPLPHLAPADAAARFHFDLGGPEDGAIYIATPCLVDHYLPPAVVNERLAQEKLSAFVQIASALGARRIDVKSGESLRTDTRTETDVPLPDAAAQVGLGVSFRSTTAFDRQVVAEFDKPTAALHVPEGLQGWLDMEPTLRAMVRTRLEGEPIRISVILQFGSMVDVGADLTARFAARGLKVGGAFRKVAASRWSFDVEFWPKRQA